MTIEKKIEICIGTDRAKNLRVRLSLLVVDGDATLSEHFHSVAIEPGADLAAIRAGVEAHITTPNGGVPGAPWPKIPDSEWADVEAHVGIAHKPEIVARFAAAKATREGA